MNKTITFIILTPIVIVLLLSVVIFTGGYGSPTDDLTDKNSSSNDIYYGSVGYRQKLTSGRNDDIIVLAKFSDYTSCNLWIEGHKKDNTVVESACENSQKPDTVYLEKIIQQNPGDRTYLSFIDTIGISVRVMPLSGSSEDSTLVALVLKKQLESSGIANIKVIYRSN